MLKPWYDLCDPEFKAGWKILLLAFFGIFTSAGVVPIYSFGSYAVLMQSTLNVTMGEIQRCITFTLLGGAVGNQSVGWLSARYGLRSVVLMSLLLLSTLYAVLAMIPLRTDLLYLFYFLFPVLGCGTLHLCWNQLVGNWFLRHRGMALAIILSGTGVCSMTLPLVLSVVFHYVSWQSGFYVLCAITLAVFLCSCRWLVVIKESAPLTGRNSIGNEGGVEYKQALKMRHFWVLIVALTLSICSILVMITNLVPILVGKGLSSSNAAFAYTMFGGSLLCSRLLTGYLVDRIWAPLVAFVALMVPSIGCFILMLDISSYGWLCLAAIFLGVGAGAEYDIASYIVSRYFGLTHYMKIFGTMMGVITVCLCVTPVAFGCLLDSSGSYTPIVMIAMGLLALGAVLFLFLGPYPDNESRLQPLGVMDRLDTPSR